MGFLSRKSPEQLIRQAERKARVANLHPNSKGGKALHAQASAAAGVAQARLLQQQAAIARPPAPSFPAAWYPDPNGDADLRFYDGVAWSTRTATIDP
jgi:hypothetical protein